MAKTRKKFKFDKDRIAIVFLTIVFAFVFRVMTHDIMRFETVNFNLSIWISPILGLLLAQYVIEREIDLKETAIFAGLFFLILNILNAFPSLRFFDLIAGQMKATSGVVFSLGVYVINIPLSVIVSDMITDRMKSKK